MYVRVQKNLNGTLVADSPPERLVEALSRIMTPLNSSETLSTLALSTTLNSLFMVS